MADCEAYVDKLAHIGTNYSPGKLVISASAGGYGNTNFVLDNVRHGTGYGDNFSGDEDDEVVASATNGLLASGVSSSAIIYNDGLDIISNSISYNPPQITNAANVAGYISWGFHSALGIYYSTNNAVNWTENSSWYVVETIESFNGERIINCGNFIQWFSSNAFGGTNYSNTPVGAVSYVEEPNLSGVNTSQIYFGLWAAGKNLAICAWNSRQTPYFQAVGDPFAIE